MRSRRAKTLLICFMKGRAGLSFREAGLFTSQPEVLKAKEKDQYLVK